MSSLKGGNLMDINLDPNASFQEGLQTIANELSISIEEVLENIFQSKRYQILNREDNYKDPTFSEAVLKYKDSPDYRKKSKGTHISYEITLEQFKNFLLENYYLQVSEYGVIKLSLIKSYMINDFLMSLKGKSKKGKVEVDAFKSTKNRKLGTIRSFFKVLINIEEFTGENPAEKLNWEKEDQLKADYLTSAQQQKALDIARTAYFGTRNFTIVLFFLNTGCRMEGAININWDDIDFNQDIIYLNEKNEKLRPVPLVHQLKEQLLYYKHYYRDVFRRNPQGPVFINLQGKFKGSRITEDSLRSIFEKIYKELGFEDCKLHRTRRTYALNLLEDGYALNEIQFLLGHVLVTTTIKYLRVDEKAIREKMQKDFPLAVTSYKRMREMGLDIHGKD